MGRAWAQNGSAHATAILACLAWRSAVGFHCQTSLSGHAAPAAGLDRGSLVLPAPEQAVLKRGVTRSVTHLMAADDKLPDVIKGTGGGGDVDKSRFMPVSFDRDDTPAATATSDKSKLSAPRETEAGARAKIGGEDGSTAAKMNEGAEETVAAGKQETKKEEMVVKPEDVPTSFQPHAQQLLPDGGTTPCIIKVVGVGGGGGNAVNRMVQTGIAGVEFWALNTDAQALSRNLAPGKLAIGQSVTRGLGAGGVPSVGRKAAEESIDDLRLVVEGSDMVFVTCGMGGGTGSGAAPLVAEAARDQGSLTVGVVTKPFAFEGRKRMSQANEAIELLREKVDTLIVIANDKLLQIVPESTPVQDAFLVADDILRQGVVGISEIIIKPGLVNVDFADVRAVMSNAGTALMGLGKAKGKTRAADAAKAAIESPLLDFPVTDAKGIVFNIIGDKDLTLAEINEAANVIYTNVDRDANIIFGALVDPDLEGGELQITVLATGFEDGSTRRRKAPISAQVPIPGAAGAPRPIRTQIPPAMERPAASLVRDQLVYEAYEQPKNQRAPPSLGKSPFQKERPKKRGILRFLRRILLGRRD